MRTLDKNKTTLWLVNPTSKVDVVDDEGFYTGETTTGFTHPVKIRLALYPFLGSVVEQIFGKDYSCDQMAVSNEVILTTDSLIFLSQPVSNYATTYDYRVDKINKSLNTYQYGLRRRT